MIETIKEGSSLQYKKLTEEEKANRKILGRLVGPIADCLNPTRNGRLYTEALWDKVFENPIMKEKFKNKVLYGELGHPADRTEIDMEKIAVCMSEPPKKNSKGQLEAVFDILDTPNGRILKTLCDYGSTLGISSRGQGEVLGDDSVDPDTYDCECFDIVLVPAVESARLNYVTESLGSKKASLTEALNEEINKATSDDQVIMKETLSELDIKLDSNDESREDIKESISSNKLETKDQEANNVGSDQLVESLKEAIKAKSDLEASIQSLQGELAVSNTKVDELTEEVESYKANSARLSTIITETKEEAKKVSILEAKLNEKEEVIKNLEGKVNQLTASREAQEKTLTESISGKDSEVKKLNESLSSLQEKLNALEKEHEDKVNQLTESFKKRESQLSSNIEDLTQKLANSNSLAEGYKNTTNAIVNAYIQDKARMIGCEKEEIINRLPKKYNLKDINTVCESLKKYKMNMNKLPFDVDRSINKVTITESSDDIIRTKNPLVDDEVDDMLLSLVNKNK